MKRPVGILVGGGPAPGINGVIAAATIEAINRGHTVIGIPNGFEDLCKGDSSRAYKLSISDVSWIPREGGSILFTSRANPKKSPEYLANSVKVLKELGIGYLITIGGDDTASSAQAMSKAGGGAFTVGHVPKTIDNDLPLPEGESTFGFQSAREVGTEIVETLTVDAKTTSRWYLVIAMGRKAGHLALGIGVSANATLTLIPEEFGSEKISLQAIANIIAGSIIKRIARGRRYGVAVLAEGLAEALDLESIPELAHAERDPHGNIRFREVDFGLLIKNAVRERLDELGVKMTIVDKNVGYELRCRPPIPFDREYTRELGFGVVDFLLNGGSGAMITRQKNALVPIPFAEFVEQDTGRSRIRLVNTSSAHYAIARQYMIRLSKQDLADSAFVEKMAAATNKTLAEFRAEFSETAERYGMFNSNS